MLKPYKTIRVSGLDTKKEQDAFKTKYLKENKSKLKKKYAGIDFEFY